MSTNYKYGVRSYGAPVEARYSSPWATHYFVDYDNGSDANGGIAPNTAKKTIQGAIDVMSGGDIVYIRPRAYQWARGFRRYTENVIVPTGNITGSGNVSVNANMAIIGITPRTGSAGDINGVRVRGVGAGVAFTVNTHAFHMENIDIFAEAAGAAGAAAATYASTAWTVGSDGASIYNCCVKGAFVLLNGSADQAIVNSRFHCAYNAVVGGIKMTNNGNHARTLIKNCEFLGGVTTSAAAGAWIVKETGCSLYEGVIRDCYFSLNPTGNVYIQILDDTSTGLIANCHFAVDAAEGGEVDDGGLMQTGCTDESGMMPSA